jgi:putative transposase
MASANVPLLLPETLYHIYNRGNNREDIFKENRNYDYFMNLFARHVTPAADLYAYCLLPNHFHFLIKTKELPEGKSNTWYSKSFSNFFNAYAKAINKSYERTGSLFQERFRRKEISSERYFTEIVFYIHGNPQKHNIADDFRNFNHSSYHEYINDTHTYINKIPVLDWFGGIENFIKYHDGYRESLIEKKFFLEQFNDE